MAHSNISIFVPHVGCPHMCAFCNQRTITGVQDIPHADDVERVCTQAMDEVSNILDTEIAFFGGSFTAVPRSYMLELLQAASKYVGEGKFKGIRLSTRPDYIDRETLDILKAHGVTSIELGAQSLCDHVLEANERGHTAQDVYIASELIKEYGFELGLQIMTGLYQSSCDDDIRTMQRVIEISPKTIRIYPTVIIDGTKLAALYREGTYRTVSFEQMKELCSVMLERFDKEQIDVIRCGLHASDSVEGEMVGGFYHPAFKELCESEIFKRKIEELIKAHDIACGDKLLVAVSPSSISKAVGHKRCNAEHFKEYNIKFVADKNLSKYECELRG